MRKSLLILGSIVFGSLVNVNAQNLLAIPETIEHNDRINESHELYADMINPRQIASADKVLNNEDRKKKLSTPHITLPEGVKKQFEKLQAKELKGSGQSE